MALSTIGFRSKLFYNGIVMRQSYMAAAMSTLHGHTNKTTESAVEAMHSFWEKNQALKRPNSPWVIYKPHLPMITSLCHRVTGISMGVVFYAFSIGTYVTPGDFTSYIEMVKNLQLPILLLFPIKAVAAFPLVYHYINGIRHLTWDTGRGFELKTQYKSGIIIMTSSIIISALLASISYW